MLRGAKPAELPVEEATKFKLTVNLKTAKALGINVPHNRLMSALLLHGEWDLNHHRRPDVPWLYLPQLAAREDERLDYGRQYLRLWRGPRLCTEPAPESLSKVQLTVHSAAAATSL